LYIKTSAVLYKLDLVLCDINQYGFLFHLDKGWLRDRKRQIEGVGLITSSKELGAYLQAELAKINASALRIQQAAGKAKEFDTTARYYEVCEETKERLSTISQSLENTNVDIKKIIVEE
jgi:phospholipid/cholesterol/gamma-HCH transport system substrate-binding protein